MKTPLQLLLALSLLAITGLLTPAFGQHSCQPPIVDGAKQISADKIAELQRAADDLLTQTGTAVFFYTSMQQFTDENSLIRAALNECRNMRVSDTGVAEKSIVIAVSFPPGTTKGRIIATSVGGGFRTVNTDWATTLRRGTIIPYLKNGDFAGGFLASIVRLKEAETPPPPPFEINWTYVGYGILIIGCFVIAILFFLRVKRVREEKEADEKYRMGLRQKLFDVGRGMNELVMSELPRPQQLLGYLAIAGFTVAEAERLAEQIKKGDTLLGEASTRLDGISAASRDAVTNKDLLTADVYIAAFNEYSDAESLFARAKANFDEVAKAIEARNQRALDITNRLEAVKLDHAAIQPLIMAEVGGTLTTSVKNALAEVELKITESSDAAAKYEWEVAARRTNKAKAKLEALKAALTAIKKFTGGDFSSQIELVRANAERLMAEIDENGNVRHTAKAAGGGAIEACGRANELFKSHDLFGAYFQLEVAKRLLKIAEEKSQADTEVAAALLREIEVAEQAAERVIESVRVILQNIEGNGGKVARKLLSKATRKLAEASDAETAKERLVIVANARKLADEALSKANAVVKPKQQYKPSGSSGGYNWRTSQHINKPVVIQAPSPVTNFASSWPSVDSTPVQTSDNIGSTISSIADSFVSSVSSDSFSNSLSSDSFSSSVGSDSW